MEYDSPCSCLKKYRKIVGVLDIIIGIVGFVRMLWLTFLNRTQRSGLLNGTEELQFIATELNDELHLLDRELLVEASLYITPSLLAVFVGISVLVATRKDSFAWSRLALVMILVFVTVSSGIVAIVFGMGIYWMRLIPLIGSIGVNVLFLSVAIELYFSSQHLVKF